MIGRLDHLRKHPTVFRHLTVAVFDDLAAGVVPAVEAAHHERRHRPDRQPRPVPAGTGACRPGHDGVGVGG